MQEHAERPEVVQQLIADAQVLVQQAQQLDVRLDKDIIKLQVIWMHLCLTEAAVPATDNLSSGKGHSLLSRCLCLWSLPHVI